jgi:two-component sensor histidine kinase
VITLSEQDAKLRYTWMHNPRPPLTRAALGRTDAEVLEPASAAALTPLKKRVLTTGAPLRTQVALPIDGEDHHFELKITPAEPQGKGLLVAAVDVTQQKRQQEHLQVIMRELAHRAKNLLSLVDGIARQTAKAEGLPQTFIKRFGDRLAALGEAHDLLVSRDWKGVDLPELAAGQLAHILPEARERILIDGPPLVVSPEVGQYLALALHELATNATKYGALGRPDGAVQVRWRAQTAADGEGVVELEWVESGASVAEPKHSGFGRLLLERLVPRAVKGRSALEFGPDGLTWRLSFGA